MKIIFILEFGKKNGLGHLARCSNLAENLRYKKFSTCLITSKSKLNNDHHKIVEKYLMPFNKNIYYLKNLESKENFINHKNAVFINKIIKNNIVIIDHYYLSKEFVSKFNNYKSIIHFKDDIFDEDLLSTKNNSHKIIYFLPKIIINERYEKEKNVFYGLDLFPLFPSYLKLQRPKAFLRDKLNIFIAPGSNKISLFNDILLKIDNYEKKYNFRIFTPDHISTKFINVKKVDGTNGLYNYIFYSDLVICAAGNVMLETLFIKSKAIVYTTNRNQISLINYLENLSKVFYLRNIDILSEKLIINFAKESKNLLKDKSGIKFCCDKLIDIILSEGV